MKKENDEKPKMAIEVDGKIILEVEIDEDNFDWIRAARKQRGKDRMMRRYNWNSLNKQQVGTYAEYFVKMELTMYGFQVYTTEVDDRGIDFVARYEKGAFIEIQVKSVRSHGYIFMQKSKFSIKDNMYLALCILHERIAPDLYLIPSTVWLEPDTIFVDRDYNGKKSAPEWGINLSKKNISVLEKYKFEDTIRILTE